jgi:bacterioferritin
MPLDHSSPRDRAGAPDPDLLAALNQLLSVELGAINQYMVHAEICESWGHDHLAQAFEARTAEEMRHVQRLVSRILALGGRPGLGSSAGGTIGADVEELVRFDLRSEEAVVTAYEQALATTGGDPESRSLVISILEEEHCHVSWLRAELLQIETKGLEEYLAEL